MRQLPSSVLECVHRTQVRELAINAALERRDFKTVRDLLSHSRIKSVSLCASVATTYHSFRELGAKPTEALGLARLQLETQNDIPIFYRSQASITLFQAGKINQLRRKLTS